MIQLIVGLGNPGPQYQETRHNVGFWWVDALAASLRCVWAADKGFQAWVATASVDAHPLRLLKPQTFMNLSGRSVASLARFYKIDPTEILVVHDDLDFEPGRVQCKLGGGHAGHNGLRDVHAQLGTDRYWRLRLGIGHPGHKSEVVSWVLHQPEADDRVAIERAIERSLAALPDLLAGHTTLAMQAMQVPKEKPILARQAEHPRKAEPVQQVEVRTALSTDASSEVNL
ncbi:aminoacyl-tRNA hydrolase [Candidatus Symbiobacter mobilis]|uniref:Peptidyl-tRNA hydrolase n=1 Tax=Candidatus Symbiobacter mobilis CR TaxID=946483 RepID=U5N790_9BURK|nr:aminoacyl-tRNA hydrolase [Candidatus Symbiobacter mobilis]AGX87262.1 PTH1 family peptidyl-tRNA hydrolase [Candidatus Symbiobacter mobilis CR]